MGEVLGDRIDRNLESPIQVPETRSAFPPRVQRNAFRRRDARQQSRSFKRAWTRNYHLSTSNYLTSAHVDGPRLNPMINQRSANVAGTAIKAMTTRTETAYANG